MKIGILLSLRPLYLLEISLLRRATLANHDDYWLGRLTVSVTRSRYTSQASKHRRRVNRAKKRARNRSSVLSTSTLRPVAGRPGAREPAGLNRAAGSCSCNTRGRTDHDGLVREEKTHARGIQSGGGAVDGVSAGTLGILEVVARFGGSHDSRNLQRGVN